jgi:chloride channel 3/4/5
VKDGDNADQEPDARINGIRVWYSSFTSIDWLHDAIKDSARFARLRKRPSLRARIRLLLDRGLGWLIVTVVGFLTAVVAFFVIRSEQWLFDLKEGFCGHAWWKAKRFCCFSAGSGTLQARWPLQGGATCPAWRTWSDTFSQEGSIAEIVDYLLWTAIAVSFVDCATMDAKD